jgi:hypothetical protein
VLDCVIAGGQWAIESPHWLRDTLYREDHSTARTRSGPRTMATLRNLAVGALHLAGRHDTTETTRWASRNMDRPFTILGLMILKRPWPAPAALAATREITGSLTERKDGFMTAITFVSRAARRGTRERGALDQPRR